ncbi:MAG: four helix bundle protein [Patescibacteria group bacterium]|jgi:four helix bundle protein
MKIKKFEEIISWQKAGTLSLNIYKLFKHSRDFSFRDQIQRASISMMNNIAEGFERKTNKEFKNFLYIAKGSCAEVRSMLYIAFKLEYINQKQFNENYKLCLEISKTISGLIKTL